MAKYEPLGRFLRQRRQDAVDLSFAQIEGLLGALLPKAARSLDWWRTDAASPHATAWRSAGFRAEADPRREVVRFRREGPERLTGAGVAPIAPVRAPE